MAITVEQFAFAISNPSNVIEGVSCYTQHEEVSAAINLTMPNGTDLNNYTVTWTVSDHSGLPILSTEQSLALSAYSVVFNADELGTYTISILITDLTDNDTWERSTTIETCNFIYAETAGVCSEYILYNMSTKYDITYEVELIGGQGANKISGSTPANTSNNDGSVAYITLLDAGIHSITATWFTDVTDPRTKQQQVLIINNWCEVWDCLAGYINQVLCKPEELCNPCPDSLRLNEMLLFNQTYSMMMNKEYSFNNYYSALDESKLMEFQTMNALFEKIKAFCARLDCKSSGAKVATTFGFGISGGKSSGGCGC